MLEKLCTYQTFSKKKNFQIDCGNLLRLCMWISLSNFKKIQFFWKNRWNELSLSRFFQHGKLHQKIEFFVFCRWTSKFEWELCRSHPRWSPKLHWHRVFSFFTVGGQKCVTVTPFLEENRQILVEKSSRSRRKIKKKTSELHRHHFLNHY